MGRELTVNFTLFFSQQRGARTEDRINRSKNSGKEIAADIIHRIFYDLYNECEFKSKSHNTRERQTQKHIHETNDQQWRGRRFN